MKKGFTLLEMIVVVCVLSIIFLLSIPNITKVIQTVEDKGCLALLKVVDTAILQFKLSEDRYPNDIQELLNAGFIIDAQIQCKNNQSIRVENGKAILQ